MIPVTRYQANDGTEFRCEHQCREYEALSSRVERIMARLPSVELRGTQTFQHDPQTFLGVQRDLVLLFEGAHPDLKDQHTEWAREADRPAGMTLIGRYIDDCGEAPLRRAWGRIMRTDGRFVEHEQPYYAIQADRAAGLIG